VIAMTDDPPDRSGWFWQMADGRRPPPPAIQLLGYALTRIDPEHGAVEASFDAKPEFVNSMGAIQGGFLAAMLDATLGSALGCTLPAGTIAPTLELKINYIRAATVGRLCGSGRVVHRGNGVAFLEGELRDSADELIATATSTVRLIAR
jgi:uncharacterized protein (TIGR00369 family)